MRFALALMGLMCGAAAAHADTSRFITSYCSNGFGKPAMISAEGRITIGGKPQKETPKIMSAGLVPYNGGTEQHVLIFRDRVFWPCDK